VCRCSVAEFSTCVINCDKTVMARKDLENVLRNLYCFLEILQTSRSEDVSSWDKQSLDNALKWAAFAEQVISDSKIPFHIQFIHALLHFPGYIMRLTFDLQNSAWYLLCWCFSFCLDVNSLVTRGNDYKLVKDCRYDLWKCVFSQRMINFWDSLTSYIVNSSSVLSFEVNLESYWIRHAVIINNKCKLI